jgi:hypothetical protein
MRSFFENRAAFSANFLVPRGYTGQTTETLALPNEAAPFERVVGVPMKPYLSLSWTWSFGRIAQ